MQKMTKEKLSCYSMKMRIYPSPAQAETIDRILRALELMYNMTFHEVFQGNPEVCSARGKEGQLWPDFKKITSSSWKKSLAKQKPIIDEAPAASITTNNGLFLTDGKRAWKVGMHNLPIGKADRKDFHFYNSQHPRRSFTVQITPSCLQPSEDNPKVAWLQIPKIKGKVKARGFNRKTFFGENGVHTYVQAIAAGEITCALTLRISKDSCGDYYASITFVEGNKCKYICRETIVCEETAPIGLDVGIKDIAILNDGTRCENMHFKLRKKKTLKKMSRKLSRRWGPANSAFRDYNREIRNGNRQKPDQPPAPLATPSNGYLKIKTNHARLERKIARQRDSYYHQKTAEIVRRSSMIAVETLKVKNMMRNHKIAYALSDAAMSDFIAKLKYKAARSQVKLKAVGMFEPTSQLCSCCGFINPAIKDCAIRNWTCPKCSACHDRDINAAKNILALAQKPNVQEEEANAGQEPPPERRQRKAARRPRDNIVSEDEPNIVIRFSMKLTTLNNPRYVIMNKTTDTIIDDAQGTGYRSVSNARNAYKAKAKWASRVNNK